MPLIRCAKCGQAYDVPGAVAVHLTNAIATCHCGEWLAGSKAAVLARLLNPDDIKEIDLQPYRVEGDAKPAAAAALPAPSAPGTPRSVRIIARGTETPLPDGEHVLRVGAAILSIETTAAPGLAVEPIVTTEKVPMIDEAHIAAKLQERAAAEAPTRSVLVCIDGPLNGQEFEIPSTGLVVGREGHVRVPDEYLSRKHFEVLPDSEGAIRVRDLGSRNGTFLNTLPASNTKVHSGDEIRAGTNRFRIEQRA